MRAATGLAALALLTCVAGTGAAASDPPDPIPLRWAGPLAKDFAALPRVTADTPQARAVNAALDGYDAFARADRSDCLAYAETNDNIRWSREIAVPMTGPRFLTVVITKDSYCGGAHGDWRSIPLTFDLETGGLIDWSEWLPDGLTEPRYEAAGLWPQMLRSQKLQTWYAGRALASMDDFARETCAETLADTEQSELLFWLDAKGGGLGMRAEGFAYARSGCGVPVVMPVDELERLGAKPELVQILRTATRDRLWRDHPDPAGG